MISKLINYRYHGARNTKIFSSTYLNFHDLLADRDKEGYCHNHKVLGELDKHTTKYPIAADCKYSNLVYPNFFVNHRR